MEIVCSFTPGHVKLREVLTILGYQCDDLSYHHLHYHRRCCHDTREVEFITVIRHFRIIFVSNEYQCKTFYLTNKEAQAVYYTVIKHDGDLRTRGNCRKREAQASAFYISRVFSNDRSVLSQCNTRLKLLHLLYDIEVMWRKTIKHAFSMFYTLS